MGLFVAAPGLETRIVVPGRAGRRSVGVPWGGPADRASYALANALVGNPVDAPALEFALLGPTLRTDQTTSIAICGAPFEAQLESESLEAGRTFETKTGQVLRIGGTPTGCRGYLAVAGGFHNRPGLLKDTFLNCEPSAGSGRGYTFDPVSIEAIQLLRVLPGPQADWFSDREFYERIWTVSPSSNRMGVRLVGEPLNKASRELVSEAVAPGAIQVANDGLPIILGVDGQTIGGYPKIAHIIRADMDRLGQLRPGQAVQFRQVAPSEASLAAEQSKRSIAEKLMRIQFGPNLKKT